MRVSAGIAVLGERVIVHGRDLHHDCLDLSFVHYMLYSVTGRDFDPKIPRVLERLWIATGYPDARIWCNRVAGYMGSARVPPSLSMCAALAACNSVTYGFGAMTAAYEVQLSIPSDDAERERWLAQQLAEKRVLLGYGRPIHRVDERLPVALKILADESLRSGPALKRAFWLHRRLQEEKGIGMNISAVWAALCIDFGISCREYQEFMLLLFSPGQAAAYADQRSRPPFAFLKGYHTKIRGKTGQGRPVAHRQSVVTRRKRTHFRQTRDQRRSVDTVPFPRVDR
jgi:hypothetical protein